jgi:predicted Zn-ribbon and HTH transcriptional regulator
MIHGKKEKTHKKTRAFKRGQITSAPDNEKSPAHQDLELATLNAYRKNVGRCGDHNHLQPAGCHRCGFVPRKWAKIETISQAAQARKKWGIHWL